MRIIWFRAKYLGGIAQHDATDAIWIATTDRPTRRKPWTSLEYTRGFRCGAIRTEFARMGVRKRERRATGSCGRDINRVFGFAPSDATSGIAAGEG